MDDASTTSSFRIAPEDSAALVCEEVPAGQVVLCGTADPTQPGRATEDRAAMWTVNGATVLTIADGVGGHATGGLAAELAIDSMSKSVLDDTDNDVMRHAVMDAFETANKRVCELGTGAATTLATAIVRDGALRALHVGDSAILIVGGRGTILFQTVAHSPVGYAVEAGILSEDEALHHADRHVVSNVIGTTDMRVEVHAPIRLKPRDTVVLATDGVLDNLDLAEVADLVRMGPLKQAAERLAAACRQRMLAPREGEPCKPDDATFILFRLRTKRKARARS
jgi:serine/threonine protein phosphatase PrpC